MKKFNKVMSQFICLLFLLVVLQCEPTNFEMSEKEFVKPSMDDRPLVLWTWMNGYVDTVKLVYELEEMKEKGLRGAVIWDIGSLADPDKIIPVVAGLPENAGAHPHAAVVIRCEQGGSVLII